MDAPAPNSVIQVRLLYFAALRELMNRRDERLAVPLERRRLSDFLEWLEMERPALAGRLGQVRCAIDGELAGADALLPSDGELALLPPFAGG